MATKENPELTEEEKERFWKSMANGEKFNADEFWKYILPNKPSPPTETRGIDNIISTHSEPTNYNNRSYSSGYPGGYHSSVGNLNGSSGFSQGGGGHSNFFATAKSWR
jgi:hypothetical protein